jgi:hypothetical protein
VVTRLAPDDERRLLDGAAHAAEFFMGTGDVHQALQRLARALDDCGVDYAIADAMALNQYGYRRVTEDVDVLLTEEGLRAFKAAWLGRGYVEKFPGSKGMRDTQAGVAIDVLLAGEYPGDGKPKPVRFPDPAAIAVRGELLRVVPLELLLELKLASGMSAPHRLRDLSDVIELIRHAQLPREMAEKLDASVRDKFIELWAAAQVSDPE